MGFKDYYVFEDFEEGDKVRLLTDWYEKHGFPFKKGDIFTVEFCHDCERIETNKGEFSIYELELVKE